MKKKIYPIRATRVMVAEGKVTMLRCLGMLVCLLGLGMSSCKKVTEQQGIVGLCPIVVSTDPADKAVDVALDKFVMATFNTDIKPETINEATFGLKQNTTIVTGTLSPTNSGMTFGFRPQSLLLPFTTYTGTITTAVKDKFNSSMVSNRVWTFTTIPKLSVSNSPTLGGSTSGAGLFAQGATVTVNALPASGFTFVNWTDSGTATVASVSANYQFAMNGNRALVANFAAIPPAKYGVVISANPTAGGTTFGGGAYNVGTQVTIIESPNPGFTFVNWTENGTIVSLASSYQFVITANKTFVANFSAVPALQFAVILSSSPQSGGTTTGAGTFTSGSSVNITATPLAGYTFVNWTEGANVVSNSANYTLLVAANRTLVANFVNNTYSLSVSALPTLGGLVVKAPNLSLYNSGSFVTTTATPNSGYTFVNWTEGTQVVSTNPTYIFLLNTNRVLVANFQISSYTLNTSVQPAEGGKVAKNINQPTYNSGSTVLLTATANPGYVFDSWSGDANGSSNPLSVLMTANKNITANFTIQLGAASLFGAFGGSAGITNQGINTQINNGGIGTTAVATLITGFHDGLTNDVYTETPLNIGKVTGGIFAAPPFPGTAANALSAQQGLLDATTAYNSLSPSVLIGGSDPNAGELGGLTLAPGIYRSASGTFGITAGNLTLDAQGDPNARWVFQCATSLTVGIAGPAGAKSVVLINGGLPKHVFWYVGSAATINGAGGGVMSGTIIATSGITFSTAGNTVQTVLNGRAISLLAAVTMVNTTINNQ